MALCAPGVDETLSFAQALVEQIEMLKTMKADKEDVVDALAEKADAQAVNTKVSCAASKF